MSISNNIDDSLNYIFFGHQNRFKGYVIDSFNECINNRVNKNEENEKIDLIERKIRFCNGAILKLTISSNIDKINLNLSLIYDGDTNSRKKNKPYWTSKESTDYLKKFIETLVTISIDSFKKIFKLNIGIIEIKKIINKPLDLYFVRHGFSIHNKGIWQQLMLETNTELTGKEYETQLSILLKQEKIGSDFLNDINNSNFIDKVISKVNKTDEKEIITEITDENIDENIKNVKFIVIFFIKIISYYLLHGSIQIADPENKNLNLNDEISKYIYISILMHYLGKAELFKEPNNDFYKIITKNYDNTLSEIISKLNLSTNEAKILKLMEDDSEYNYIKTGIEKIVYSILIDFIKKNPYKNNANNNSEYSVETILVKFINLQTYLKTPKSINRIDDDGIDYDDDNDNDNDDGDIDDIDKTKEEIKKILDVKINDNTAIIKNLLDVIFYVEKKDNSSDEKKKIEDIITKILTIDIVKKYLYYFLYNVISFKIINDNGIYQSQLAGKAFSNEFNGKLDAVFVSDLIRTQQTAGYFLSELTNQQFIAETQIVVLPCFHELRNNEKDGQKTVRKGLSQATRIFTLGTTHGVLNRENNTNCRATIEEKSWSLNPYVQKDCSTIMVGEISHNIDWSLYKDFYKGYRDQNKLYRKECINHHFIGIFLNYIEKNNKNDGRISESSSITAEDDINRDSQNSDQDTKLGSFASSFQENLVNRNKKPEPPPTKKMLGWWPFGSKGGRTKRKRVSVNKKRRTKKNYRSKSKKVRKIRRVNKSKKGKKKATRRK